MEAGLVDQGVELMLFGMGTVVSFLTLLVFATLGMSAVVSRLYPAPETPPAEKSTTGTVDAQTLAVISAAIHQHRRGQ